MTIFNRSSREKIQRGLGGPVVNIDYSFLQDRIYIGTQYKDKGMIRIYSLSSTLAKKYYDILVPKACHFLVYPNDKTIYLKSGHVVRYDLPGENKDDPTFHLIEDHMATPASEWKLGNTENSSYLCKTEL